MNGERKCKIVAVEFKTLTVGKNENAKGKKASVKKKNQNADCYRSKREQNSARGRRRKERKELTKENSVMLMMLKEGRTEAKKGRKK